MSQQVGYESPPLKEVCCFLIESTDVLLWPVKPFFDYVFPDTNRHLGRNQVLHMSPSIAATAERVCAWQIVLA